jgi:hypothetical protein
MSTISSYPNDGNVTYTDKLIGTDANDSNKTKNFTVGDILALPIPTVPVYANNAARDAAITAPAAGMIVFNTTGTKFQGYTGAAWVDLN